jgi:hypothetical protein
VYCVFYNAYGEVIRASAYLLSPPGSSLAKRARSGLPFDDIPEGWNNQMPQLVIARIEFA